MHEKKDSISPWAYTPMSEGGSWNSDYHITTCRLCMCDSSMDFTDNGRKVPGKEVRGSHLGQR